MRVLSLLTVALAFGAATAVVNVHDDGTGSMLADGTPVSPTEAKKEASATDLILKGLEGKVKIMNLLSQYRSLLPFPPGSCRFTILSLLSFCLSRSRFPPRLTLPLPSR